MVHEIYSVGQVTVALAVLSRISSGTWIAFILSCYVLMVLLLESARGASWI